MFGVDALKNPTLLLLRIVINAWVDHLWRRKHAPRRVICTMFRKVDERSEGIPHRFSSDSFNRLKLVARFRGRRPRISGKSTQLDVFMYMCMRICA